MKTCTTCQREVSYTNPDGLCGRCYRNSRIAAEKRAAPKCKPLKWHISIERGMPPAAASGKWWHWQVSNRYGVQITGWVGGNKPAALAVARNARDRLIKINQGLPYAKGYGLSPI